MMNNSPRMTKADREKWLYPVYVYGFAVDDVKLFLDTHPDSCEALSYFNRMRDAYEKAKKEYEENVGPLSAIDADVADGWTWPCGSWPWEGGNC